MSERKHSGTMTYVVGDRGPESITYYGGAMVLGRMGGTVSCTVDHGGAPCPGYPPIYDLRQGQSPYPPLNWDGTPKDTLPEDADASLPAPEEKPYDPAGDGCECGCKVCREAKERP